MIETKTCQNCKQNFTIEPEDFDFYKKIDVPPPTFCPQCRFQRRLVWRNERKLFRNKSSKSGKDILALYPPQSGIPVYEEKEWWSDDWDAMGYGREYDFSKSFFVQLFDLMRVVPKYNRNVKNMENSDYSGNSDDLKNCYLLFNSNRSEDCMYGNANDRSRSSIDNSHINNCERVYGCFWLNNCYQTHFASQCVDSTDMQLCRDCQGCSDCFGCANLRDKKYHIFNVPYTKEGYQKKIARMKLNTWGGFKKAQQTVYEFWKKYPNKFHQGIKNINSTGAYVTHSKNVRYGFLVREGENLKYVQYLQIPPNKDCYDITAWGNGNQLAYENAACGNGMYNVKFSHHCWPDVRDVEYSIDCHSSVNLFGCVGVRKKQYCIFNKQYSREEYEKLRAQIIEHMNSMPYKDKKGRMYKYGEFFPIELSPFGYNMTIANEHFPLDKEGVVAEGYPWIDSNPTEYQTTMRVDEIPDAIEDVNDDILKQLIQCADCKRAYRILELELQFLKREGIPAPRTCVDCRHNVRISQRLKSVLYHRTCDCGGGAAKVGVYKNSVVHFHGGNPCPNSFETAFNPEAKDIVYCEECYQQEVV